MFELILECPVCEGQMVVHISGEKQVKELFQPCAVCQVLSTANIS